MEKEFDLLDLIMEHRLSHHYVSGLGHELDYQRKIDVERSDDEMDDLTIGCPNPEHEDH